MKRAGARESLDIEELLISAYRDNYVDRVSVMGILAMRGPSISGVSSTALVMAHVARGTAVDTSTAGATFAGRAGQMQAVGDDLIDLHGAVLGLPRFYVQLTGGTGYAVWDDHTLALAHNAGWDVIEGGTIERPTRALITRRHDGAAARGPQGYHNGVPVAAGTAPGEGGGAVVRLHTLDMRAELVANGRAATRPDVSPLVVERYRPRYSGRRKLVGYDPVYETLPSVVALQRATYAAWHCSLAILAEKLQGLDRYHVTGPEAPAEPWTREDVELPARYTGRRGCA